MSQKWILGLLFAVASVSPLRTMASQDAAALNELAEIPILHEGRIKPLDTFARTHLLAFWGKSALPDFTALEWLAEVLFTPEKSAERKVFDIRNPQVLAALSLNPNTEHRYTFNEIFPGLGRMSQTLMELERRTEEEKTPEQKQLLDLFMKALRFRELNRTFTLFLSAIEVPAKTEQLLGLPQGVPHTFLEIRRVQSLVNHLIESKSPQQADLIKLRDDFAGLAQETNSEVFKILPAQWSQDSQSGESAGGVGEWFSPASLLTNGEGSPETVRYLDAWKDLSSAYLGGTSDQKLEAAKKLAQMARQISHDRVRSPLLSLEHTYNQWSLFHKALAFYVLAFLLILASGIPQLARLRSLSFLAMLIAFGFHTLGLGMRITIMGRPPVATLYESIIFVAETVAFLSLIYEWIRRNGLGLICGSTAAAALHFMALGYAADGDTMGMLAAVLNTNFWLATHVVAITIGYGCSIVAGILGHVYLIEILFGRKGREQRALLNSNMVGASLIALFFTMFGTILGGIWADQSWGRFWGWDPKENGALLIVLWLLMLIHGRLSERLRPIGFAAGLVLTNAVVAIAWFGVNLLNVGLHSYGFTDSVALNLGLFVGAEMLLSGAGFFFAKRRERTLA